MYFALIDDEKQIIFNWNFFILLYNKFTTDYADNEIKIKTEQ